MVESAELQQPVTTSGRRLVVLGASNATLGLAQILAIAQSAWGPPLDVIAALGHGRSYGQASTVMGRTLPSIVDCGLWDALAQRPPLPTYVLITDIGNDIVYGHTADRILRWIDSCLERLSPLADRLIVTRLPILSLAAVSPGKFKIVRRLLFPGAKIDQNQAMDRAEAIDQELLSFSQSFGAYVVNPDPNWYGWDPIHIRRRYRSRAWRTMLGGWFDGQPPSSAQPSRLLTFRLLFARPNAWHQCGFSRQSRQPTYGRAGQLTLSLY